MNEEVFTWLISPINFQHVFRGVPWAVTTTTAVVIWLVDGQRRDGRQVRIAITEVGIAAEASRRWTLHDGERVVLSSARKRRRRNWRTAKEKSQFSRVWIFLSWEHHALLSYMQSLYRWCWCCFRPFPHIPWCTILGEGVLLSESYKSHPHICVWMSLWQQCFSSV